MWAKTTRDTTTGEPRAHGGRRPRGLRNGAVIGRLRLRLTGGNIGSAYHLHLRSTDRAHSGSTHCLQGHVGEHGHRLTNVERPVTLASRARLGRGSLSLLVHGLYVNSVDGIVTKGHPVLHPQVTSLSPATNPTQVTITDCFDDTHWLEYKTEDGLVNSTPGGHHATTAVVQDITGVWKVSSLVVQAAGTC